MATSKFLRFQDKNNDNLIDACETEEVEPLVDNCPACKPNLAAIVPDWRTKTIETPFYNEKIGAYQVTVVTEHTDTGGAGLSEEDAAIVLQGRFYARAHDAVQALLDFYEKSDTSEFKDLCQEFLEYKAYDLATYPNSRLKLLYSIPCNYFYNIPSKEEEAAYEEEQSDEDETSSTPDAQIIIDATTYMEYSMNVRQGLELYNRYLKVFRALKKGNFVFEEGPRQGAIFDLSLYGDNGISRDSLMYGAQKDLTNFLKDNKILMPGSRLFASWHDPAVEITLNLKVNDDNTRRIESISITTEMCGTEAQEFTGTKIEALLAESPALRDQVVLGYLQNLSQMNTDLTARTPKPWKEFIEEHTIPAVTSTINHIMKQSLNNQELGGCLREHLEDGAQQLGQNLLDEVFSIGDAIAYQFRFQACQASEDSFLEKQTKLGLMMPPIGEQIPTSEQRYISLDLDPAAWMMGEGYPADVVRIAMYALEMVSTGQAGYGATQAYQGSVARAEQQYQSDYATWEQQNQRAYAEWVSSYESQIDAPDHWNHGQPYTTQYESVQAAWESDYWNWVSLYRQWQSGTTESVAQPAHTSGIWQIDLPHADRTNEQYLAVIGAGAPIPPTRPNLTAPGMTAPPEMDMPSAPGSYVAMAPTNIRAEVGLLTTTLTLGNLIGSHYNWMEYRNHPDTNTAIVAWCNEALGWLQHGSADAISDGDAGFGDTGTVPIATEAAAALYAWIDQMWEVSESEAIRANPEENFSLQSNIAYQSMWAYAREQAFGEIDNSNQIFAGFCGGMLNFGGGLKGQELLDQLLESIKLCGMSELMLETMGCLMQGLPFDEAMAKILEAALKGMNVKSFYDLFVGLPPDKRRELDELLRKKIAEGNIMAESGSYDSEDFKEASDSLPMTSGDPDAPEERMISYGGRETLVEDYNSQNRDPVVATAASAYGGSDATIPEHVDQKYAQIEEAFNRMGTPAQSASTEATNRPLYEQLDMGSEENRNQLSENVVIQLYIQGLLEIYQGNLLEALDLLNKFPGGPLIAQILASLNCPVPPGNITNAYDFIKDLEIGNPLCNANWDWTIPEFVFSNPFDFAAQFNFKDIFALLKPIIVQAINEMIIRLIIALMQKVCELIGSISCQTLKATGAAVAGAVAAGTGREALSNIIKNAICGPDANQSTVDETIVEMVANLGLGAAAFANKQRTLDYMNDIASAVTPEELSNAVLGNASEEFKTVAYEIRKLEYPEFESALPHKDAIGLLFENCGNLMPLGFQQQLKDYLNSMAPAIAANPSLCASPDDLERFENLRCDLLAGRATPGQCAAMSPTRQRAEDLGDLANIFQDPDSLFDQPLVSDPGCDNAPIPFQPESIIAAASTTLNYELDMIKMAFADDMIGNGPWESHYGMLNMILSDTQGNPLSAHNRKVSSDLGRKQYVDYYLKNDTATDGQRYDITALQKGAYPIKIASWLQTQMAASGSTFDSNNEYQNDQIIGSYQYKKQKSSIIGLGDSEKYNISYKVRPDHEDVLAIAASRKSRPDLTMEFYDNNMGYGTIGLGTRWDEGFVIEAFISDVTKVENVLSGAFNLDLKSTTTVSASFTGTDPLGKAGGSMTVEKPTTLTQQKVINLPSDNMRIKISSLKNTAGTPLNAALTAYMQPDEAETLLAASGDETFMSQLEYEFMAVDGYLSGSQFLATWADVDMSDYPKFLSTFENRHIHTPSVVLLNEILEKNDIDYGIDNVKGFHDFYMSSFVQNVMTSISGNAEAFTYGALLDELTPEDTEYVVAAGQTEAPGGTSYYDAQITVTNDEGEEETRSIVSEDKILGISRMQYNMESAGTPELNRVFYLDPVTFGGKYLNPPLYIKPMMNKSWLGMVDVMFPGESACKPAKTDVVTFEDIGEKMEKTYQNVPEDPRLGSDPACFIEMPYQRVLERYSVAAIEGVLTATIRSYVTSHFIKSLATMTYFKPDFVSNFSSAYIQYIVEDIERDLRDSQNDFAEFFNPFKDEEFWYSFLEQGVQLYSRRVGSDGDIKDPPAHIRACLTRLNDKIEQYMEFAKTRREWSQENKGSAILDSGLAKIATVGLSTLGESYEEYTARKVFEFVQATEEDAKIIFGELVKEQVEHIADKFLENLSTIDWKPTVTNLDYFFLQTYAQGGIDLDLDKEIKEEYLELPEGNNLYTSGGEFTTPLGKDYVGYYHTHTNEEGNVVYMEGEEHIIGDHDQLTPVDSKVIVPIGDIAEYDSVFTFDANTPFIIEKYVKIDGAKYTSAEGKQKIQSLPSNTNISDHYPGTMELVFNDGGAAIGLTGELGVRCGIQLSLFISEKSMAMAKFIQMLSEGADEISPTIAATVRGLLTTAGVNTVYELLANNPGVLTTLESLFEDFSEEEYEEDVKLVFIEAEVDALDTTVDKFVGVEANSKLLLCLINKLVDDPMFQMLTRYIFPFNKIISLSAIYNDLGLLPSIGQISVGLNKAVGGTTLAEKPGKYVEVSGETLVLKEGAIGWAHPLQRDESWFVNEYHNWDQIVMRSVKKRAKKLFKGHYLSRNFDPIEDAKRNNPAPGAAFFKTLRNALKPLPGERLLPRWKKKNLLKGNPFNSDGQICSKDNTY